MRMLAANERPACETARRLDPFYAFEIKHLRCRSAPEPRSDLCLCHKKPLSALTDVGHRTHTDHELSVCLTRLATFAG